MALFDLSLDKLREYRPERDEPGDFDAFWADTLGDARSHDLAATFEPYETLLSTVDVYDVTFAGFGGQPVKGWFLVPRAATAERLPCVVSFIGYGGGRGLPHERLLWSSAGYAELVMDTRGQGSQWGGSGATGDPDPVGGPATDGYMTRGIEDPEHYYYRRVYTDAVRAVEAARSHPRVDPSRIAVSGGSQGGGITLAAAGLAPDQVAAVLPDVPFLCHWRRSTTIVDTAPYNQIGRYLAVHRLDVEQAYRTLSYFDGVNMSARATAPALFSTGLMDEVCPPSTVFAAYNHYKGRDKDIKVYQFNGHEGGGPFQEQAKLEFLDKHGLREISRL